jgi:3',5'-cyclic AMP phosphodiesterase CpdA
MIIVQLSDLHVCPPGVPAYGRVPTNDMLRAAIENVNAIRPRVDVVLATGDLAHAGAVEEYAMLRQLLAELAMPVYLVPGNHDDRANLRKVFGDSDYLPDDGEFVHYAVEDHPVRLIGLDTVVPGAASGELCERRRAWLEETLAAAPDQPTVIFMHHPPFRTDIGHMDVIALKDADAHALGRMVERNPQIERILCGHVHRSIQVRWHGTLASTAPSTAHQVVLDLRPGAPGTFALEPPGYQVHTWSRDVGIISHTASVGRFDGPHSFPDDGTGGVG